MSAVATAGIAPRSESEAEEAVRAARSRAEPLEIVGGGTKRGLGRPTQTAATMRTDGLAGVTLYEPSEMVIAARAGTPLTEVEATLKAEGQRLPFEPVTLKALYGKKGRPTIGAVAACNLSGPRRVQAGAARDGLIGVAMVTGRGEIIRAGGRVMKNVAGYDLVRLAAGSFGTLGVLTEVTFKVLPAPETEATIAFEDLDDAPAVKCLAAGLGSPWEVTGAAHLPGDGDETPRTLLRLEGFESQVRYRADALARALSDFGAADVVKGAKSAALWRKVADLAPLGGQGGRVVWKVSTTPGRGPELARAIRDNAEARLYYDWGGGLIWISLPEGDDGHAETVRTAVAAAGGHATLMRGPDTLRSRLDVFQPLPEPVMALTRKVKETFDPDRLLNPGRMYAGV